MATHHATRLIFISPYHMLFGAFMCHFDAKNEYY